MVSVDNSVLQNTYIKHSHSQSSGDKLSVQLVISVYVLSLFMTVRFFFVPPYCCMMFKGNF